jgi:cation:H+ antiporter
MLTDLLILIVGFALLVWSADRFVFGSAAIARNFGLSPMIIGLTIVAMGSSAPEIMVSATAALNGQLDTGVGNVIGSNITNIALVLGLTALLKPLTVDSQTLRREMPLMLGATLVAGWLLYDSALSVNDGVILLVLFFLTIGYLTLSAIKNRDRCDPMVNDAESEVPENVPTTKALLWLVIGLVVLPLSANLLVDSASNIARYFGMSDLVIGLTIIAIGTSLPELAACITSVIKHEDDLALGNIIGSNIFNILAVLAVPGLIAPGDVDPHVMAFDYWYMLAVTIALLLMALSFGRKRQITRIEGGLMISAFIAYQLLLFYH